MGSLSHYQDILRSNRAFARLWGAELLSIFGDWFNLVALYAAADAMLGTSSAVGLVLISKTVPVFLVSPIAGPLVERMSRRNLMIVADLARAVFVALVIVSYHLDSVPLLYLSVVVSTCFTGLFMPARTAALPMLVETPQLPTANALLGATWSVSMAFGAAASGLVTELLGVEAALSLDILSYLLSARLLSGLPSLLPPPPKDQGTTGFVDGLRYLKSNADVAMIGLLKSGMAFSAGSMPLISVYGNHLLSDRPAPWIVGLLFASRGFGAGVGCLYARAWFGESDPIFRRVVTFGLVILAVAYIALGFAESLWFACAVLVIGGFGNSLVWVPSSVLLQWRTASEFHGRVFALEFGVMTLVFAVAVLITTSLVDAEIITARWAMVGCGCACLLPAAAWWLWNLGRHVAPPEVSKGI